MMGVKIKGDKLDFHLSIIFILLLWIIFLILQTETLQKSPSLTISPKTGDTIALQDDSYLYNAEVNIITKSNGMKTFTVDYKGKRLRQNYSDETFYADKSGGNVVVTYDIVKQRGGVDIIYVVRNPTLSPQRMAELKFDGILNTNTLEGNPQFYKPKNSAGFQDITNIHILNYINSYYPSNYYSPIIIMRDENFAAGSALHYPSLDYKQNVMTTLSKINNTNSARHGTWSHRYREFNDAASFESGPNAMIPPGQELEYTISLRFSSPDNWVYTLYPYKKYFESLYGIDSGSVRNRNLVPIKGLQLGDGLLVNSSTNPRGYKWITHQYGRVDIFGWGPFTDWFIQDTQNLGYERVMIWLPSGAYENRSNNFPPQFMTQWHPNVSNSDGNFTKYAQNGIELGFWWGNSNKVPVPNVWEPDRLVFANYDNQAHKLFLATEVIFAKRRGTELIGLDKFTQMPVYQRILWLEDMKRIIPGAELIHESPGPDLTHKRMPNIGAPAVFGDVPGVDLLAWYLNPSATIYILGEGEYNGADFLRRMSKWGYTPVPKDTDIAVSEFAMPLIECNDGIDQRNDGRADYYDCGCLAGSEVETGSVSCLGE